MTRADIGFGLAIAVVAAITLLLFSDETVAANAAAVAACLAIAAGASCIARWYDETVAGRRSGSGARIARRVASFTPASLPWPLRAVLYVLLLALALGITLNIADMLFLRESAARLVFYVLLGLGVIATFLGEFATRRERPQGRGRPSQSS